MCTCMVFQSHEENLVSDDTNGKRAVFVRDLAAGTTSRVSVSSREQQGRGTTRANDIRANGRFIVSGTTSRLVPHERAGLFVRDMRRGVTRKICGNRDGRNPRADDPHLFADGRQVSFESHDSDVVRGDHNAPVVFVCNFESGRIRRVSVTSTGREVSGGSSGAGSISGTSARCRGILLLRVIARGGGA